MKAAYWATLVLAASVAASVSLLPSTVLAGDEDDIVFLYPEHNPLTQGKFKGELTACWNFADPMADEDDILYLVPEHNPYHLVGG